ncbi:MAG TPA: penicillin-binding protein 2 [Opitutaceae bacterium]|nr:penicillin-binding protein 2 [Opitutaceae bacterium]
MSKGFASSYRIVLLATGLFACFAGLGARLVWIQVTKRDDLVRNLVKARVHREDLWARRGDILDSRGNLLATSRSLMEIVADPQFLRAEDESKWPQLATLLGVPLPELRTLLTTKFRSVTAAIPAPAASPAPAPAGLVINFKSSFEATPPANSPAAPVAVPAGNPAAPTLEPIQWVKLSSHVPESIYAQIEKLGIRGVRGERIYRRAYPHGQLAAHIIGYVNDAQQPATGIESYADFYLRGQNGWRESEKDGRKRELAQFRSREVPRADGYTVALSLDCNVQDIVEQELEYIAQKFQPEKATIIVSDPRTGFILAMGNYPTFDLNEYRKVPKEAQASMKNIAVTDVYEPGSTFKIVAASGAINEGLATATSRFDCSIDRIEYRGKIRGLPREDHHFAEPRSVPMSQIISYSSNRGAAQLAMALGEERFYSYARAFGFGQPAGFPVGGEVGGTMHAPNSKGWDGLTITRMPMGHAVDCTALQMHMGMGVIASGGNLLQPQVVQEIRDPAGEAIYRYGPIVKHRAISEATARTMARLLMGVASKEGTGLNAVISGYEVAGKTGTTQKIINGRYSERHHVASFVGFFPATNPQIAISVIVDGADAHAPGGIAYGSGVAAPSFKRIGEQLIAYAPLRIVAPAGASPPATLAMQGGRR